MRQRAVSYKWSMAIIGLAFGILGTIWIWRIFVNTNLDVPINKSTEGSKGAIPTNKNTAKPESPIRARIPVTAREEHLHLPENKNVAYHNIDKSKAMTCDAIVKVRGEIADRDVAAAAASRRAVQKDYWQINAPNEIKDFKGKELKQFLMHAQAEKISEIARFLDSFLERRAKARDESDSCISVQIINGSLKELVKLASHPLRISVGNNQINEMNEKAKEKLNDVLVIFVDPIGFAEDGRIHFMIESGFFERLSYILGQDKFENPARDNRYKYHFQTKGKEDTEKIRRYLLYQCISVCNFPMSQFGPALVEELMKLYPSRDNWNEEKFFGIINQVLDSYSSQKDKYNFKIEEKSHPSSHKIGQIMPREVTRGAGSHVTKEVRVQEFDSYLVITGDDYNSDDSCRDLRCNLLETNQMLKSTHEQRHTQSPIMTNSEDSAAAGQLTKEDFVSMMSRKLIAGVEPIDNMVKILDVSRAPLDPQDQADLEVLNTRCIEFMKSLPNMGVFSLSLLDYLIASNKKYVPLISELREHKMDLGEKGKAQGEAVQIGDRDFQYIDTILVPDNIDAKDLPSTILMMNQKNKIYPLDQNYVTLQGSLDCNEFSVQLAYLMQIYATKAFTIIGEDLKMPSVHVGGAGHYSSFVVRIDQQKKVAHFVIENPVVTQQHDIMDCLGGSSYLIANSLRNAGLDVQITLSIHNAKQGSNNSCGFAMILGMLEKSFSLLPDAQGRLVDIKAYLGLDPAMFIVSDKCVVRLCQDFEKFSQEIIRLFQCQHYKHGRDVLMREIVGSNRPGEYELNVAKSQVRETYECLSNLMSYATQCRSP